MITRERLAQLGASVPGHLAIPEDLPNHICTDTRTIKPGQWFLALKGDHFDGHDYITKALAKGAAGFIYSVAAKPQLPPELLAQGVAADDSLEFLQKLARYWRSSFSNLILIGITGSSGKTTAKELLSLLLEPIGTVLETKGSLNNEIGVPLTLCRITAEHRFAIIEMGARHKGDIKFLVSLAEPDVAVLLNIGSAHIGEFGSAAALRQAKQEIFTASSKQTIAVCPFADSQTLDLARSLKARVLSFSSAPEQRADISIDSMEPNGKGGMTIELSSATSWSIPSFHLAYPPNLAACAAVMIGLNLDLVQGGLGLANFRGVQRRFQSHRKGALTVIDDSYNANPQSMAMGLKSLKAAYPNQRAVLILGDMLELGDGSEQDHFAIGQLIAEMNPSCLVAVGPEARYYLDGARSRNIASTKICHVDNAEQVISQGLIPQDARLIYAKGSRGIALDTVIDHLLRMDK